MKDVIDRIQYCWMAVDEVRANPRQYHANEVRLLNVSLQLNEIAKQVKDLELEIQAVNHENS